MELKKIKRHLVEYVLPEHTSRCYYVTEAFAKMKQQTAQRQGIEAIYHGLVEINVDTNAALA
jgi:hypothetical protein